MYAIIGIVFCLLLGVMIKAQGIGALLWFPLGFVIGLSRVVPHLDRIRPIVLVNLGRAGGYRIIRRSVRIYGRFTVYRAL
jgi:hypothetical protein